MRYFIFLILLLLYSCFAFAQTLPSDITGLKLWLAADSGITLTGNQVSQWQDLSANNYVANISTNKPLYVDSVTIINNKSLIRFDGNSDISIDTVFMNSGNEVSVFGLIRVNIKTNFGMFACYGVSSPGTWNLRQVGSTGRASFISGQDNTGAGEIEGTPAGNTSDLEGRGFVLLSGFFDGSTNEWRLYENDSLMHTIQTHLLSHLHKVFT